MNDNKPTIIGVLFALLCFALLGGVYFLGERLREQQEAYDTLAQRSADLRADTSELVRQKRVFTEAFAELSNFQVDPADSEVQFHSAVQQAVQNNAVEIMNTRQQDRDKDGISRITMSMRGDYYNVIQVLASWRNLPMTVRVANLTLRSEENQNRGGRNNANAEHVATGIVLAEATVEAVISTAGQSANRR